MHSVGTDSSGKWGVFMNSKMADGNLDLHRALAGPTLYTNIDVGIGTQALYSGGPSTSGPNALAGTTWWTIKRWTTKSKPPCLLQPACLQAACACHHRSGRNAGSCYRAKAVMLSYILLASLTLFHLPPTACSRKAVEPNDSDAKPGACSFGPAINLVGVNIIPSKVGPAHCSVPAG
jgi:hypothetical protein